jgi:hypothetical protein
LAADALAFIMDKAKSKGHSKGVVPYLIAGGITHLQYVDDMIQMCNYDKQSITNMK